MVYPLVRVSDDIPSGYLISHHRNALSIPIHVDYPLVMCSNNGSIYTMVVHYHIISMCIHTFQFVVDILLNNGDVP